MKKTICLNMIVKNESHVIQRCLASVKPLIDTWVIADTGSSDGTQKIIQEDLKEIPGELHERPWVDFAHNRNEALSLARGKADYLLFIDADDRLLFHEDFILPSLEADLYMVLQRAHYGAIHNDSYPFLLVRNDPDFYWEGVLHEFLTSEKSREKTIGRLNAVMIQFIGDGNRSRNPQKMEDDIALLEKAVRDHPQDSRYPFYLARTCWAVDDYSSAMKYFQKRAEMGGCGMEIYYSLLHVGLAQMRLKEDPEVFIPSLYNAYLYRPSRIESLYALAKHYVATNNFFPGYLVSQTALSTPMTSDHLLVESWMYDWGALLYFFVCAWQTGKKEEAHAALQKLRSNPRLPMQVRKEFRLDAFPPSF